MFKNKENEEATLEGGKKVWLSRSMAVCVVVRIHLTERGSGNPIFVMTKRGEGVTHTGTVCFPCGYLDYNETLQEAALRELFEETGILIQSLDNMYMDVINDDPNSFAQNVTARFVVDLTMNDAIFESFVKNLKKHEENVDKNEVDGIILLGGSNYDSFEYAFNHGDLLIDYGLVTTQKYGDLKLPTNKEQ